VRDLSNFNATVLATPSRVAGAITAAKTALASATLLAPRGACFCETVTACFCETVTFYRYYSDTTTPAAALKKAATGAIGCSEYTPHALLARLHLLVENCDTMARRQAHCITL
jgi:hypothetical protein